MRRAQREGIRKTVETYSGDHPDCGSLHGGNVAEHKENDRKHQRCEEKRGGKEDCHYI